MTDLAIFNNYGRNLKSILYIIIIFIKQKYMIHNYLRRIEPTSDFCDDHSYDHLEKSSEPSLNLLVLELMGYTHLYLYKLPFKF